MSDDTLREAERRWTQERTPEARQDYLRAMCRAGRHSYNCEALTMDTVTFQKFGTCSRCGERVEFPVGHWLNPGHVGESRNS